MLLYTHSRVSWNVHEMLWTFLRGVHLVRKTTFYWALNDRVWRQKISLQLILQLEVSDLRTWDRPRRFSHAMKSRTPSSILIPMDNFHGIVEVQRSKMRDCSALHSMQFIHIRSMGLSMNPISRWNLMLRLQLSSPVYGQWLGVGDLHRYGRW